MAEPADPELVAADPAVEDGLAAAVPDADLPTLVVADAEAPVGLSWSFDYGRGRFVRSGTRPVETRGLGTLLGWIDKYLHTERGALIIHPPTFGMRNPFGIFGRPIADVSLADLTDDLKGMTMHPRIADVVNVRLARDPMSEAAQLYYAAVLDPPLEDIGVLNLRTNTGP